MVIIIWRQPEGILWMSYLLLFSCHLKSKGKRCKAVVIFKHSGRSFVINCRYRWCWFSGDLSTSLSLNLDLVYKLSVHDMETLVVDSTLIFTKQVAVGLVTFWSSQVAGWFLFIEINEANIPIPNLCLEPFLYSFVTHFHCRRSKKVPLQTKWVTTWVRAFDCACVITKHDPVLESN